MVVRHRLRLQHDRTLAHVVGIADADSSVDVEASSSDLTETWSELLIRLPNDVYAALKAAMSEAER